MSVLWISPNPFVRVVMDTVIKLYTGIFVIFSDFNTEVIAKEYVNPALSKVQISLQAERLLNDYGNSILHVTYTYLKNMSDSKGVLQETLIQFLKTKPCFESASHEKAWLFPVVINTTRLKYKVLMR